MKILLFIIAAVVISGAFFAGCTKKEGAESDPGQAELYYCPMHPEVTAPKPGVCPICHMDLVKKTDAGAADSAALMITAGQEITSNISTMTVEEKELTRVIEAYSVVEIPEDARRVIAAKFGGRVEQLHVGRSGQQILKGQPLMTVYSPDVQKAAAEFLSASAYAKNDASQNAKRLPDAARKKLLLSGLTAEQVSRIESAGEAPYVFEYLAPFGGIVIEKKILEGAYFNEGSTLYEVADLSTVWCVSDVYENDIPAISPSTPVAVSFPSLPGSAVNGKISFISPVVEKQNRTVRVRVALNNASGRLRPQMYGSARFSVSLGRGIAVPAEAVLFNGKTQVVWIKTGEKSYAAREVKLGQRTSDEYQILSGLKAGDVILSSGGYLLDSESQLKTGGADAQNKHAEHGTLPQMPGDNSGKPRFLETNDPLIKKQGVYNAVCPVLGDEVAENGPHVLYKGKIFGFCCKGCDKIFFNEPEKYLKNLSGNGKKFTGKKAEE